MFTNQIGECSLGIMVYNNHPRPQAPPWLLTIATMYYISLQAKRYKCLLLLFYFPYSYTQTYS